MTTRRGRRPPQGALQVGTRALGTLALGMLGLVLGLALIALALPPAAAHAQEGEPTLEVSAAFTPPAATIGDRVTLEVRVRHHPEVVVTVERPGLPGAEVQGEAQPSTLVEPDGAHVTSYAFRYQVFTLGEAAPDGLVVRWLREDGSTGVQTLGAPALTVVPVRQEGDTALRPLKPPLAVDGAPPAWVTPVAIGALAVLLGAAVAGGVSRWRRRRVAPARTRVSYTAEERARERLDALRPRRLETEEAFQEYYGAIATTVREYLGERFRFNATALTTGELERRMAGHGLDRWQARLVGGLLDRCDRAVYAREYPDPASADHDLTVAYEIVELSRPQGPEAASDMAAAS